MERLALGVVCSRAGLDSLKSLLSTLLSLAKWAPKVVIALKAKLMSSGSMRALAVWAISLAIKRMITTRTSKEPVAKHQEPCQGSSSSRAEGGWLWRPLADHLAALRIAAGKAAGTILRRCPGPESRPIFEKKREVIFELLQPLAPSAGDTCWPTNTCWLDLYSGTGSMGLEALSRGARVVHFVEDDTQVTREVLSPNIASCNSRLSSVIHNYKVEHFLGRARKLTKQTAPPFDVICLTPPGHTPACQALAMLIDCPLIHDGTLVALEYAHPRSGSLPPTLGPLVLARHCRLGHSWLAVYAAAARLGDSCTSEAEFDFGEEDDL